MRSFNEKGGASQTARRVPIFLAVVWKPVIHQNCGVSSAQMKFYGCTTSSYVPALI
jgi:hypothetical protein